MATGSQITYQKGCVTKGINALNACIVEAQEGINQLGTITTTPEGNAKAIQPLEEQTVKITTRCEELENRMEKLLAMSGELDPDSEAEKKMDETIQKVVEMIDEANNIKEQLIIRARRCRRAIEEEKQKQEKEKKPPFATERTEDSTAKMIHHEATSQLALPPLQKFKGKHWEFEGFWSVYNATVEKSNQSNTLKMTHLMNALEGPPKELLRQYAISESNYPKAVARLLEKYQNKEKITAELTKRLQSETANSNSTTDQRKLHDKLVVITTQLKDADENIESTIVKTMIVRKFANHIQEEIFRRKMKMDQDEQWTVEKILTDVNMIISKEEELNDLMGRTDKDQKESKTDSKKDSKPDSKADTRKDGKKDDKKSKKDSKKEDFVQKCTYCRQEGHYGSDCKEFKSFESRIKELERQDRCTQCTRTGHKATDCKGSLCKCKVAGHHRRNGPNENTKPTANESSQKKQDDGKNKQKSQQRTAALARVDSEENRQEKTPSGHTTAVTRKEKSAGIPTIQAKGFNPVSRKWEPVSVMLDTGSDETYISQDLAQRWNLPIIGQENFYIRTFSKEEPEMRCYNRTRLTLQVTERKTMEIEAFIASQLVGRMTKVPMSHLDLKFALSEHIKINEDSLMENVEPQIIVGCDFIPHICTGKQTPLPSGLSLMDTVFGATTFGKGNRDSSTDQDKTERIQFAICKDSEVIKEMNVEERQKLDMTMKSPEEFTGPLTEEKEALNQLAVKHFNETVEKREEGYFVRIPKKPDHEELKDNFSIALKRLQNVKKQYSREVLEQVNDIFRDQIEKGILEIVEKEVPPGKLVCYSPTQPVITPHKTTTKCRVVVDASAHYKGFAALNDIIIQGPTILPDLIHLLIRFRSGKTAIISDVEKAFLQVHLHEDDRDLTRVLWVHDIDKPFEGSNILIIRFSRVLFGLNVSPFLLASTILHHLGQHGDQDLAHEMGTNLYVDNLILTTDAPIEHAFHLYQEPKRTFKEANMNLREFRSNSAELNELIPEVDRSTEEIIKVLGIPWDSTVDTLKMKINIEELKSNSRRTVSSAIASIFDPVGLVTHLVLLMKLFQRELWSEEYKWDTPLSAEHEKRWRTLVEARNHFEKVLPRQIIQKTGINQIVTFTDASEEATCCCVYVVNQLGSNLLQAKSKIKPIKEKWTIPKLESQALKMGMETTHSVLRAMKDGKMEVSQIVILTDSSIALSWLKTHPGNKEVGVFINNRRKTIREIEAEMAILEVPVFFGHVASEENPADLGTKGRAEGEYDIPLWWHGPTFLKENVQSWNAELFQLPEDPTRIMATKVSQDQDVSETFDCRRTNNFTKMKRGAARTFKAIKLMSKKLPTDTKKRMENNIPELKDFDETSQDINTEEVKSAERRLIKEHQKAFTPKQLSSWASLGLIKNRHGIIVCRGRMENADLVETAKEPILIAPKTQLARQIIWHSHGKMHRSAKHTVTDVHQRFWIPRLKQQVRSMKAKCIGCQRMSKLPGRYPDMGPMPSERVTRTRPFQNTGVDYFGPIKYQHNDGTEAKAFGALFTCAVTRAAHIELVPDNSTTSFIQATRRFIATRGTPEKMISDNGPCFVLGADIMNQSLREYEFPQDIKDFLSIKEINWKFITPYSPWKGGFYESFVKIAKHAFIKENRLKMQTFEELATMFREVEAMMNSRPLTAPTEEVNSGRPITPMDFLTPGLSVTLPLKTAINELDEYLPSKEMQALQTRKDTIEALKSSIEGTEKMWEIWRDEYLTQLREYHKVRMNNKRGTVTLPRIGQAVLLTDEMQPRNYWRIATIKQLVQSEEKIVREVIVNVASPTTGAISELRRSINMIVPLEMEDEDELEDNVEETATSEPIPDQPQQEEKRYNLRTRKPVSYDESDLRTTFYTSRTSISKTFSSMLLLLALIGLSSGLPDQQSTKAICSTRGLQIHGPYQSFKACVMDYCTSSPRFQWSRQDVAEIWIPPAHKITNHHATVKISNGTAITIWEIDCPAVPFCETIDCVLCWMNVLNPECHIYWAIMGLGAIVFITLMFIHIICNVPVTLGAPFKIGWNITKWIWFTVVGIVCSVVRKCRSNRTRRSKWREIIVICMIASTAKGCQEIDVSSSIGETCYEGSNECSTYTEETLHLNSNQKEACLRIGRNGTAEWDIRIELKEILLQCTKQVVTYTQDIETKVWSAKRCPRMGSCSGEKCAGVNRASKLPELASVNHLIGNTGCSESCTPVVLKVA